MSVYVSVAINVNDSRRTQSIILLLHIPPLFFLLIVICPRRKSLVPLLRDEINRQRVII